MNWQEAMTKYLIAFIQGLESAGVKKVVISPGSRSTPLALLLHRHPTIMTVVDVDERSAGFLALGMAKKNKEPIGLVCTSGTAAANYYPAICEAEATNLPLIVMTTDRPPELRDVGAPQAMEQQQLYSSHVKKFIELAVPEASEEMYRYSYWHGMKMTQLASQTPRGPVHLNLPLREPLLPDLKLEWHYKQTTRVFETIESFGDAHLEELVSTCLTKRGVIIVGGSQTPEMARDCLALAEKLGWPIMGDPLTNLANCGKDTSVLMRQADLFLAHQPSELVPEVVVRIGVLPVSKNIMLWLKALSKLPSIEWVLVDEEKTWKDQLQCSDMILPVSEKWFVQRLLATELTETNTQWLDQWKMYQFKTKEVLEKSVSLTSDYSETSASLALLNNLPENSQLFVANSNAIRFVDRFGKSNQKTYRIFGNRGVNGIDGIISTSAGLSLSEPHAPQFLLVGDLTLFHDMNGLQLMKQFNLPITIVVLNNNGGGIFSFLSQRQLASSDFVPLFGTPLNLNISKIASLYEAEYAKPATLADFKSVLDIAIAEPKFRLIEVTGKQAEPVALYEEILNDIEEALRGKKDENNN